MTQELKHIYPAPTMVIGVGKFGLATLEHLAEDWHRLKMASHDPSIKNLRLLHVRPKDLDPNSPSNAQWRKAERQYVELAKYTGQGDLPSLCLDFVILRSLGLIRYRDGNYQVAMPRDGGLVERVDDRSLVRRRYFDWLSLHPDPIASAERIEVLCDKNPELGLFVKPMINRVRQGHSPRAMLRCISRCRALSQGRDPSPWVWFYEAYQKTQAERQQLRTRVPFNYHWIQPDDLYGLLEGFADEPIHQWQSWFKATHHDWVSTPNVYQVPFPSDGRFDIVLPSPFVPTARDLPSPLKPFNLLRVDWETNGWAAHSKGSMGDVEFMPVPCSMYRLGLFDHDSSSRIHQVSQEQFQQRLEQLGTHAHRGLVRLWVDLQRSRVEDQSFTLTDLRRREGIDETLKQSLEVLGELIVRPLLQNVSEDDDVDPFPNRRPDDWIDEDVLSDHPSDFLIGLELERRGEENQTRSALTERLIELGFSSHEADIRIRPLFKQLVFEPHHLQDSDPQEHDGAARGLLGFRHTLNEETRHLFNLSHLASYRHKPSRRSARLTVYLVADVGEPFVRASIRPMLREIHAELLRAFAPIFENFRQGFDRSLCIVPILWMPHPADAFGGLHPVQNRCEEAVIIEAIQGVRRWVETVPRGTRCIPQVIINSRVTDNAVLSLKESVRQTRDFLAFQTRNDLGKDPWLRKTVVGPSGDDFFSSFSCHEIEFPAQRAREYLANRLARETIGQIKRGEARTVPELEETPIHPPEVNALLKPSTGRTRQRTKKAAETTGVFVEDRLEPTPMVHADEIVQTFDENFEHELLKQIYHQWRTLTRARGEMDGMMDDLRRETSTQLNKALDVVHKTGNQLIDEFASVGGLKVAQAGFNQLEGITRENLVETEAFRQRSEEICRQHRIPQTSPIASARERLLEEAERKPDHRGMLFGLFLWALMVPALGAPLAYALSRALQLTQNPNAAEFVLGTLGPIVGGLALFLPAAFLLRRHMQEIVEQIAQRIADLADTARTVVEGSGSSFQSSPSIRSFIEARLQLTAALNTRNYAQRIHERVVQDTHLAHRLSRSIDIQEDILIRRAEDMGVRMTMEHAGQERAPEDLTRLFATRDGMVLDFLVQPEQLRHFYLRHYGDEKELLAFVPVFIDAVGGFSAWRQQACMSQTPVIMAFTRQKFEELVQKPVSDLFMFEDEVGSSLVSFVAKHYANMGFGAKFIGYEGLDPDGLNVLCDTSLVIHPALRVVFTQSRREPSAPALTETLDVVEANIIPNSAYMLSFVQGIRPHSVRNLMRFESYHDRTQLPDDRTFPMSGEPHLGNGLPVAIAPINHLTGFEGLSDDINARILDLNTPEPEPPNPSSEAHVQSLIPPSPFVTAKRTSAIGVVDLTLLVPEEDLLDLWLRQEGES